MHWIKRGSDPAHCTKNAVYDHADTADPDHLADHVDENEAVEERPAVFLERLTVVRDQVLDNVTLFGVLERDTYRRLRSDMRPSMTHRGQLDERTAVWSA